jgi:hypothetical protein
MVSTLKAKTPVIRASKIHHKSSVLHPLVRFVTEETAAMLFNLKPDEIYRIDCWQHVVYVHGKGVSKFVSYADFPPILGVEFAGVSVGEIVGNANKHRNFGQYSIDTSSSTRLVNLSC